MSEHDLPPLPPKLASLLADEAERPEPAAAAREQVFARLAATIGALPPLGGGGGDPDGSTGGGEPLDPPAPPVPPAPPAPPIPSGLASTLVVHPVTRGLALLALGGALGIAVDRAVTTPPAPQIVYVDKIVAAPSAASTVVAAPSEGAAVAPSVAAMPPRASEARASSAATSATTRVPASPATRDEALAAERATLEIAKTALGRRDYAAALQTLQQHETRFPRGQLAEEREALAIQALVGNGRTDAARARGDRFKKTFPGSLMLPVLEAALR